VTVVGAGEQGGELDPLEILLEAVEAGGELPGELGVGLVLQELVGRLEVAVRGLESVVAVDAVPQAGEPLGQLLAPSGVVPDRRVRRLALEVAELRASAVDVKGTPSPRRSCRGARGADRSARSSRRS
jgi:hypothetical protein